LITSDIQVSTPPCLKGSSNAVMFTEHGQFETLVKLHCNLPDAYPLTANPLTVKLALHGVVKLPVVVQVRLNTPVGSATLLVVDTTTPSASVHE